MQHSQGIAAYETVNNGYIRRRQLQGNAGSLLLWGLGVGAVISGDFYGWNYGLASGGFWGFSIAAVLMAIMYLCLVYSTAELSTALPHAGGFYSFTRYALGPFWGFICGITVTIEYVLANAALVFSLSNYLKPLFPNLPSFFIWVFAYAVFLAINIRGFELSVTVCLWLTIIAMTVLAIFYVSMLVSGEFNFDLLFNIPAKPGQSETWLPNGWFGVFGAIPFAIWLYLAIEQLPMTAEETDNVPRNMPTGMISGMVTLIILSIFTVVINSGVGGGAVAIGQSDAPLQDGLEAYFGAGATSTIVTALALICGLIASLHGNMFAYGRIIFSLSRAGYFPRWLSVTSKTNTPHRALIAGATIGFICVLLVSTGIQAVDAVILNMAVFGALISYILVMVSYMKLKGNPYLPKPYESPLGTSGAFVGLALATFALVACMSIPDYRGGVWGIGVALIVASVYFLVFRSNRLVAQAPEEATALGLTGYQE